MPAVTLPSLPHYVPAPVTEEPLEYADLTIIDISKAATEEGRAELSEQVRDALRTAGFFYVINHGYTQAETDRMFDIADVPFTQVEEQEKREYAGKMKEVGSYQGYKFREYWHIDAGVRDQIEHYNINKDITKKQHPKALRPFLPEIDTFIRHNHFNVLYPILRLLAISLELPEETLVKEHGFTTDGETWMRAMKYYPRSEEDDIKANNVWLKGHVDFGSITILWSQPVSALQIMSPDGKWRYVKHIDNALVVNAGDTLDFLTGGYYKGTIHRVVKPPVDQQGYTRLGLFYFAMPDDDLKLFPHTESPFLQKHGIQWRFDEDSAPVMRDWRKSRVAAYGQSQLEKKGDRIEEEIIEGVVVKHYS